MQFKERRGKTGISYIVPIVLVDSRLAIPAIIEFIEQILSRRTVSKIRKSDVKTIKNMFSITRKF